MKKIRKILAVMLAFVLTVSMSVAGTVAYLTSQDSAKNTFTSGKVVIDLTEAKVVEDEDGNLVAKADGSRNDVLETEEESYDYGTIYPGQTIFKDPTIELLEGSEDAYIAAVVTVTDGDGDIEEIIGCDYEDMLDISLILSGGYAVPNQDFRTDHKLHGYNNLPVYGNTEYAVYQVPDKEKGVYKFYFFVENVKSAEETVLLFDTITIPTTWGNDEMAEFAELEITIDAYAVQEHGFKNCYEAMTTAFKNVFPTVPQQ